MGSSPPINKELVLKYYAELHNLAKAAAAAGHDPSAVYRLKQRDPEFAEDVKLTEKIVGDYHLDRAEVIANNDKHPASGIMTMFLVKRYHPEFRDNQPANQSYQDNRTVNIMISESGKSKLEQLMSGTRALPVITNNMLPSDSIIKE